MDCVLNVVFYAQIELKKLIFKVGPALYWLFYLKGGTYSTIFCVLLSPILSNMSSPS